jgi:antitoxin component YwqK of YwqJK toxin-antitoxin module
MVIELKKINCRTLFVLIFVNILIACKPEHKEIISTLSSYPDGKPREVKIYSDASDSSKYCSILYFPNGRIEQKGNYSKYKMNGSWMWWYDNGQMKDSAELVNEIYVNRRKHWYRNGKIKEMEYIKSRNCKDDCCDGYYVYYDSSGMLSGHKMLKNGSGYDISYKTKGTDSIYTQLHHYVFDGKRIEWAPDSVRLEGQYENGHEEGTWYLYKKGEKTGSVTYLHGKKVE